MNVVTSWKSFKQGSHTRSIFAFSEQQKKDVTVGNKKSQLCFLLKYVWGKQRCSGQTRWEVLQKQKLWTWKQLQTEKEIKVQKQWLVINKAEIFDRHWFLNENLCQRKISIKGLVQRLKRVSEINSSKSFARIRVLYLILKNLILEIRM